MSVAAVPAGFVALSPLDAGVFALLARKGLAELRRDGTPPDARLVTMIDELEAVAAVAMGAQPADPGMPTPAVASESVLTVADLVARTGKSERTVRQWCSAGRWPSARRLTSGQWVVNAEDLEEGAG